MFVVIVGRTNITDTTKAVFFSPINVELNTTFVSLIFLGWSHSTHSDVPPPFLLLGADL